MARHKYLDERNDPFVGVFDDPVAGVFKAVDFGIRKELDRPIQKLRREAPVAYAPDEGTGGS
jgi:hypothetical protein